MPRPSSRKVRVDLIPDQELSVEVPLETAAGEPMFAKFYVWLIQSGIWAKLSQPAWGVYGALLGRADFESLDCFPSISRIMADTGLSRPAVVKATKELIEHGLIAKRSGRSREGNTSNRYIIIKPPLVNEINQGSKSREPGVVNTANQASQRGELKQKTKNQKQVNQTKKHAKKRVSADASVKRPVPSVRPLARRLSAGGMKNSMVAGILSQCDPADVTVACDNADALAADGILANWAGYVVRTCFGALEEESTIRPTRRAKKQRTAKAAAAAERETVLAQARAERRSERQILAAKRFGDLERWEEIDLQELE